MCASCALFVVLPPSLLCLHDSTPGAIYNCTTYTTDCFKAKQESLQQQSRKLDTLPSHSYKLRKRYNMPASRKINSSGEVVEGDSSSDSLSSSGTPLLSGGHHIDVFGFNLDVRQFLITLALAYLMLGQQGSK